MEEAREDVKYFARFLPSPPMGNSLSGRPVWVHITARVGSIGIGNNSKGGWYSYSASKAPLNQAMHAFVLHLKQTKRPAMAVAIHPGTMKADLREGLWNSVPRVSYASPRKPLSVCLTSSRSKRRISEAKFGTGWGGRLLSEMYSHDVVMKIQG